MKGLEMLSLLTEVEEAFIEEAAPQTTKKKWIPRLLCAAASIALILYVGMLWSAPKFAYPDLSGRFPVKHAPPGQIIATSGTLSTICYNGAQYDCRGNKTSSQHIAQQQNGSAYQITGVSSAYAVAIKAEGSQDYAVYFNRDYFPKNIRQWETDLSLSENGQFTQAVYTFPDNNGITRTIVFPILDDTQVYDTLFGAKDAVPELTNAPSGDYQFSLSMDIPSLGCGKVITYITEDGYAYTQIGAVFGKYRIGKQAARGLMQSFFERTTGYELVFDIPENTSTIPNN